MSYKSLASNAGSFVEVISRDSNATSPFVYQVENGATGAGAGKIYWADSASGANQIEKPDWITSVVGGYGSLYGGETNADGSVTVTYKEYT